MKKTMTKKTKKMKINASGRKGDCSHAGQFSIAGQTSAGGTEPPGVGFASMAVSLSGCGARRQNAFLKNALHRLKKNRTPWSDVPSLGFAVEG